MWIFCVFGHILKKSVAFVSSLSHLNSRMLQKTISLRMRDITFKKLIEFSRKEERSICELIRMAVDAFIEKLEEKYGQRKI